MLFLKRIGMKQIKYVKKWNEKTALAKLNLIG